MTAILNSQQFESAIECARPQWLKELLKEYLPKLVSLGNTPSDIEKAETLYSQIKERFADRGLTKPSQQKNRITDVRNAIKIFDPHHPVLDVVGLSTSQWIEINSAAAIASGNRSTQFIENPSAIVQKAEELMKCSEWSKIAASLAVVTGRRISEILKTAEFEYVSKYSVQFVGAVKRRNEAVPLEFEIPTLVPARSVLSAIAILRREVDTEGLTNRQINACYEKAVATECDRAFRELVPTRDGKANLYTHLFRAVYATIASHWFCPPTVSDLEFRAYIQGHFKVMNEKDTTRQTDMASQRHYWDYKISDGSGNVDGRLGIRLGEEGVEVLKAFATLQEASIPKDRGSVVKINVWEKDRASLARIQEELDIDNRANTNGYIIGVAQSLIELAQKFGITPEKMLDRLDRLESLELGDESEKSNSTEAVVEQNLDKGDREAAQNIVGQSSIDEKSPNSIADADGVTEPVPIEENTVSRKAEQKQTKATSQISYPDTFTQIEPTQLFHKMDVQQGSIAELTDAIHQLIEVLSSANSSPSSHSDTNSPVVENPNPSENGSESSVQKTYPTEATEDVKPTLSSQSLQSENQGGKQKSLSLRAAVECCIDLIMAHNNDPTNRSQKDKWYISISLLMRLADCSHPVASSVHKLRKDEIKAHHSFHDINHVTNKKDDSTVSKFYDKIRKQLASIEGMGSPSANSVTRSVDGKNEKVNQHSHYRDRYASSPVSNPHQSKQMLHTIGLYVDAVIAHNNSPGRSREEKWYLDIPLLTCLSNCPASLVEKVYEKRHNEITAHNFFHQLRNEHNKLKYSAKDGNCDLDSFASDIAQRVSNLETQFPLPVPAKSKSSSRKSSKYSKGSSQTTGRPKNQEVRDLLNRYVDAIMAHNNAPGRPQEDKFRITGTILMRLCGCSQVPAYDVCNTRSEEIKAHHSYHQLTSSHNLRGQIPIDIEKSICIKGDTNV